MPLAPRRFGLIGVLALCIVVPFAVGAGGATGELPVLVASFAFAEPRLSSPLHAGEPVHLVLEALPADAAFEVRDAANGIPLASGRAGPDGIAHLEPFLAPTPTRLAVAVEDADWTRWLDVHLPPVVDEEPVPPPEEAEVLNAAVEDAGRSVAAALACEGCSLLLLDSDARDYGHWRMRVLWYKVENEDDPKNRYIVSVTRWHGGGTSHRNPYHEKTLVYHDVRGWRLDGNAFMVDWDPTQASPYGGTMSFSVGKDASAQYGWEQESPAYIGANLAAGTDPSWDDEIYQAQAIFSGFGHWFQGRLEYAAQGVSPTGHTGYSYVRMIHTSCSGLCATTYTDDTDWVRRPIDWA